MRREAIRGLGWCPFRGVCVGNEFWGGFLGGFFEGLFLGNRCELDFVLYCRILPVIHRLFVDSIQEEAG